jgi:hypothetical protein
VSDRNKNIPNVVMDAVNSKDIDKILVLLNDGTVTNDSLTTYMIEKLEKALKEGLYGTDVNNILEILFKLNKMEKLRWKITEEYMK